MSPSPIAVATTSGTAPPSQSMDKSPPPPPSPPQTTESSFPTPVTGSPPSAGSLDPLESSSSSPNRNNQLDMQASLRSEEYRQLFRLPPEEVVIALHLIITTAAILCPVFMILRFDSVFLSGVSLMLCACINWLNLVSSVHTNYDMRSLVNSTNKVLLKKVEEKPKPKVTSKPILMKILKVISVIRKMIRFYVLVMIYVHFFILLSLDVDGNLLVITGGCSTEQILMIAFW